MAKLKKLPPVVYVAARDNAGDDDDPWLECQMTPQDVVDDDGPTIVGTYKLVEVNSVTKSAASRRTVNQL